MGDRVRKVGAAGVPDHSAVTENRVVVHHERAVARLADVEFDPVRALVGGAAEGRDRVLREVGGRAAMADDQGHVESSELFLYTPVTGGYLHLVPKFTSLAGCRLASVDREP